MKILSLFALGSLILLGGCQPREAGRTRSRTPARAAAGNTA